MRLHKVKRGDTLRSIAGEHGVSPIKLAVNNGIADGGALVPGEELLVIIPTRTVNARRGESLGDIARRFDVGEDRLLAQNPELHGGGLYDGQPITVKQEPPLFGLGIGNGYFYRGTPIERLVRALPYLNYVTVCSAVSRRGGVSALFDGSDAVNLARAAGKLPLLRLYLTEAGDADEGVLRGAALMAEAEGYHGVTLAGAIGESGARAAKDILHKLGLKLVVEEDAACPTGICDIADMTVLTYDKLHLSPIPDFDSGERAALLRYSEAHDAYRAFVDLSPFALCGEKYVTKAEARDAVLRGGGCFEEVGESGVLLATVGRRGRERRYKRESLASTEKLLRLVSELGYLGISFDIARAPIAELMMFRSMFSEGIGMV